MKKQRIIMFYKTLIKTHQQTKSNSLKKNGKRLRNNFPSENLAQNINNLLSTIIVIRKLRKKESKVVIFDNGSMQKESINYSSWKGGFLTNNKKSQNLAFLAIVMPSSQKVILRESYLKQTPTFALTQETMVKYRSTYFISANKSNVKNTWLLQRLLVL